MDLQGAEQIDGFIEQTQERFPGVTFTLGSPIDAHHNQARFQWHAGPADAPDAYVGFDVIVTEDGRIRTVHGFIDAAPAASPPTVTCKLKTRKREKSDAFCSNR